MRYFFEIAYKGSDFHGWQRQNNAHTVQEEVETALSTMLRQTISIMGSGRTDTGVHCEQQFFHTDIPTKIETQDFKHKLNSFLPNSVAINQIRAVTDEAHARFDALSRTYQYRIVKQKNPFLNLLTHFYPRPLDIEEMNKAATHLIGQKDFECFSKVKTDVNNFVCNIGEAKWHENGDVLMFEITANRFLRGMVRAIVGTMLQVGSGKIDSQNILALIDSKNRKNAGSAAPAKGLFLTKVEYPDTIFIKDKI